MAEFQLTGFVEGFGGSSGNLQTLDLDFEVTIGNFTSGFSQQGIIQTLANDTFSATINVPDTTIPSFAGRSLLLIRVKAFVPMDNRQDANVILLLEGSGQEIFDQMVSVAQNLRVGVDLTGCTFLNIRVNIEGRANQLDRITELALNLVSNPESPVRIASITARREDNFFRGRLICRTDKLEESPAWLLLHQRTAFPVNRTGLRQIDVGRVFMRTRALSGAQDFADAGNNLLLKQVESQTGVGTISEDIPNVINEGILFVRDLDLDFVNGNIRVRGRVGFGAFGVQLFGIGRFQVTYGVNLIDRDLLPCRNLEFNQPFRVQTLSHTYDLFPDTDLDELGIGDSELEKFISGIVADTVLTVIKDKIRDRLADRIDEMFEEITETLEAISEDPESFSLEIRDTMFVQIDRINVDADNITIRAFTGVWHTLVGLQTLDCAANTASVMFFSQRPLSTFRRFYIALSHKRLAPWMDAYRKHARELAQIAMRDPSLTSQVVRLAFDLQPILNEKGKLPLSANAVERLLHLAKAVKMQASPELAKVIIQGEKVLRAGKGLHYLDLIDLAAKITPSSSKPARKTRKED